MAELTREEVIARVESDESLEGEDLSGLDLSEANLSGSGLSGAKLTGANLTGATLTETNLRYAIYDPEYLEYAINADKAIL